MAGKVKNLKVLLSGDTKPYREEIDKASVATGKFKNEAGGAMNDIASAFGVNIGEIKGRIASIQTAFTALSLNMKGAAAASTRFSGAMKILKVALISTGIGAIVVALGTLVAYFTKTERGAEKVERVMAGLKAVFNVLIDRAAKFGEGLFLILTGEFKNGWETLTSAVKGVGTEMVEEAKAATALERRLQELEDREISLIESLEARRAKAAELRLEAKDEETTAARKKELLLAAMALEKSAFDDEKSIAKERADITEAQIALGEARDEDLRNLAELKANVNRIDRESANTLRSYSRELKAANGQIQAQTEATLKLIEAKRQEDAKGMKPMEAKPGVAQVMENGQVVDPKALAGLDELALRGVKAQNAMEGLTGTVISFQGAIAESLTDFGTFLGNLATGEALMSDFGSFVIGQFASLAKQVGKMMILFGVSAIALRLLVKNPVGAIAAGIALVALGTIASNSVSKALNGGGGTAAIASSAPGNYTFDVRPKDQMPNTQPQPTRLVVTGELKLKNGELVAALHQEQSRRAIS